MRDAAPQVNLQDYTPPAFVVYTIALEVDIREAQVTVHATLRVARNAAHGNAAAPLVLNGDTLDLVSVSIDGRALQPAEFAVDDHHLTVAKVPDTFTLDTVVRFDP